MVHVRIVSSRLALRVLLALNAAAVLGLTELARALEKGASSLQRALAILIADGVVVAEGSGKRRRYRLSDTAPLRHLLGLAAIDVPQDEALRVVGRASPAIGLIAREGEHLVVVFSRDAAALPQSRAARALTALVAAADLQVRFLYHDDVRRELLAGSALRARMLTARVIYGDIDRTFPNRSRHGSSEGSPLRRPHRSVRLPSRRLLQRLARKYRLASIRLFGSATRSDFRPDSDIDVALRFLPEAGPTLSSLVEIEGTLERATDRDIDLVDEEGLRPEVKGMIEREAVPLL
jgi:predicted nucleotidyltransferase/DNA-binding transcriptional ArsR family regulator